MNKKAQTAAFGFAFLVIGAFLVIALLATIEPLNESLNDARDTTSLNCPGTVNFNQTDYDDDSSDHKLTKRTACFATGFTMLYFVGSFLLALAVWIVNSWRKLK